MASEEGHAPADLRFDETRIEQEDRTEAGDGGADPEAAVDRKIGPAPAPRRNQLLDRRIDGAVFAADAGAGEKPHQGETGQIPCQGGRRRGDEIDQQGDAEEPFAADPVGEPAEEERARNGAGKISAVGQPDIGGGKSQGWAVPQGPGDRTGQGDLQAIENPGDAECDNDKPVEPRPREPVQTRRNVGDDNSAPCLILPSGGRKLFLFLQIHALGLFHCRRVRPGGQIVAGRGSQKIASTVMRNGKRVR
jgi:hypothetical protein